MSLTRTKETQRIGENSSKPKRKGKGKIPDYYCTHHWPACLHRICSVCSALIQLQQLQFISLMLFVSFVLYSLLLVVMWLAGKGVGGVSCQAECKWMFVSCALAVPWREIWEEKTFFNVWQSSMACDMLHGLMTTEQEITKCHKVQYIFH